mgnify:CR=1 FL=1
MEHDFYDLINQEDRAIKALKEAIDTLKICPQCALNYADIWQASSVLHLSSKSPEFLLYFFQPYAVTKGFYDR